MKITRSREYVVNMGNYESYKFGASVEIDTDQLLIEIGTSPADAGKEYVEAALKTILKDEIRTASELTEIKTSYIHTINEDLNA